METPMLATETDTQETVDLSPNWGSNAPRGGMAVMNRILKDKATVPLFFAQTLIQSLRDVGYNHTTSALCEHVDNAIQAGATEVRIFFRQTGKRGNYNTDIAVYDNGSGMSPNVAKVAMAFGGSMNFDNRDGIARFGMGMKTAALSMSPVFELYTWQEPAAFYSMILDVEEIGKDRGNLVQLPDPTLQSELPDEVADFFRKPMPWPDPQDQELFTSQDESLAERLAASGTIAYMPQCDRLTYAQARTLAEHAVKEMSRVYRRAISDGLELYVNNRRVEAFDPTYAMPNARHAKFLECTAKTSRLIIAKPIEIKRSEFDPELGSAPITIKIFKLPIDEWYNLSRKTLKNDLRVFDGLTVSILRNGREVFAGPMPKLSTRHSVTHWYRIQIEFGGTLDEAFGVAANKQGVRLKGYVEKAIKDAIGDDITAINDEIKRFQAEQRDLRSPARPTTSETKADEADPFQMKGLGIMSPEEEAQIEANLRGLAITLKRPNETDEQAYERIKSSKYVIAFRHDDYWPFYDVRHTFGRIILTINTAHPFYNKLYEPLRKLDAPEPPEDGDDAETISAPAEAKDGPGVALDLLLLSLARTQSRLSQASEEAQNVLENLRREWSETYRVQLTH
jgi:Histidine kinase-, DNA gyrase B-, and HSP90-like ATPase